MKYKLLLLLFIFCFSIVKGQDPFFSQFYTSKVFLNPAYAGLEPGTTVELSYRDQWFGLPDGDATAVPRGYRTMAASVNFQFPCLWQLKGLNVGLGLTGLRDEAGNNPLITNGFGIANSFEIRLFDGFFKRRDRKGRRTSSRLDIRGGFQLSLVNKKLNGDYFLYSSQLDPIVGLLSDPTGLDLTSPLFLNISAGLMVRGYFKRSKAKENLYTIGFSINNITEPNETLRGLTDGFSLPRRLTFHGGFSFPLIRYVGKQNGVDIAPQIRWDHQAVGKLNLITVGAYTLSRGYYFGLFYQGNTKYYETPKVNNFLSGNFLSKNTSTLIISTGVDLKTIFDFHKKYYSKRYGLVLGVSYDMNLTGITQQNTFGVIEFQVRMNFGSGRAPNCNLRPGKFELYDGSCPVKF